MTFRNERHAGWSRSKHALPEPLDCETQALLRIFLSPILETARNWAEISDRLSAKGYGICFRQGHMVILNGQGDAVCTGRGLGVPLAHIVERIGRPNIRLHPSGASAELS